VPSPKPGIAVIGIGDQALLVDGWTSATVTGHLGAWLWVGIDGTTSVGQLIDDTACTFNLDQDTARVQVTHFVDQLSTSGLVQGIGTVEAEREALELRVITPPTIGDLVGDLEGRDEAGNRWALSDLRGNQMLAVYWSPHCGYCATIEEELQGLLGKLAANDITTAIVSTSSPSNLHSAPDDTDRYRLLLVPIGSPGPFLGFGTPCALHIGADGRLADEPAHGNLKVLELARKLAGVPAPAAEARPQRALYLLNTEGGSCAPASKPGPTIEWAGRRIIPIEGYHVGLGYDSPMTANILDDLFESQAVVDHLAGQSYAVALRATTRSPESDGPSSNLNLLTRWGQVLVRSRYASRVLRALLWRLGDQITPAPTVPGQLLVRATPAKVGGRMVLLQPGLHILADRLQPLLAQRGVALADTTYCYVDLTTRELVIPEVSIPHNASVLKDIDVNVTSRAELPPVIPGRYRLDSWGVAHRSDLSVTRFTPAEAAAATVSFVHGIDDPVACLRLLGRLFGDIDGFGLWYDSEETYVDALVTALSLH